VKVGLKVDPRLLEKAVGEAAERGIEGGLKRCGLLIVKEAQRRAPVDTGSLRSSITSQPKGKGWDMTVVVGPNVKGPEGAPYDIYQEFGTGLFAETRSLFGGGAPRARHLIKPRRSKVLKFRPQTHGPMQAGQSRWGKVISYNKQGKGTLKTTKFTGGFVFVRAVAGTPAIHYMRDGINAVNLSVEFARGFDSVRN